MARRQTLSQSARESLLALPDDELTLTRMAYLPAKVVLLRYYVVQRTETSRTAEFLAVLVPLVPTYRCRKDIMTLQIQRYRFAQQKQAILRN